MKGTMAPAARLSPFLLLALLCAGCATSNDGAAVAGSSRTSGTTTVTATASPGTTPAETEAPSETATPSTSASPSSDAEPPCPDPFTVSLTSPTAQVAGVTATRLGVSVSSACAQGASVLQYAVRQVAQDRFAAWSDQWENLAAENPGGPKGEFEQKGSVVVDVDGLGVVALDTYVYSGGAHGNALRDVLAVNSRTGEAITLGSMLAEMQRAGGPNWNFERELRRGAAAAVPGSPVTDLTRKSIAAYPSKDGLAVSVSQGAYFATAAGVVKFTIPWPRLVGDGADLSFVPDQWGY